MQQKIKTHATIIAIVSAIVIIISVIVITRLATNEWTSSRPDLEIQNAVSGISLDQIAVVALDTPPRFLILMPTGVPQKNMHLPSDFIGMYVMTKNPKAISLLLKGAQEATIPGDNRRYTVNRITFALKEGKTIGPFHFGGKRRIDCFSPTFIQGLKEAGAKIPKQ